MREFLRNAFALDDGKPCEPSVDERAVLERLVDEVVRRRLAAPALAFLEMSRPLNVVGAAVIHFFTPIAAVLTSPVQLRRFADFLERRGSIDYLCRMIERSEAGRRAGCCEGADPISAEPAGPDVHAGGSASGGAGSAHETEPWHGRPPQAASEVGDERTADAPGAAAPHAGPDPTPGSASREERSPAARPESGPASS